MKAAYGVPWWICRQTFRLYFRWRVFGVEHVPRTGPAVLAANHASLIDPPLIGAALRREISYLARENLFDQPLLGTALRAWNVVPVDREGGGAAGLRAILERLQAGHAVVLFPEGTRTPHGDLQPARSGIGLLVIRTSAPVVPIRVFGTFEAFGRQLRFPRPRRVCVKFGSPLGFEALRAEAQTCAKTRLKEIYREVAEQIMIAIARLEPCADKTAFP